MNEKSIKIVRQFDLMPETKQKSEICRQYNSGELRGLDFFSEIIEYISNKSIGE